ncbi:EVE domain-containing protein [Mycolicibacterium mengxianglii]|uniref:EVE domain-containing protein n=1 Tax=Mycolicibacterium mengxianglii TaxID=2736649 RepID=UPI001E4A19CF|nr:EVE domain-containing protein [Mycolicibacterium mengxianglii]
MVADARSITPDVFGAWVIKCNPGKTALGPMLSAGAASELWCVADNYRSQMMAPPQPVLFWVSAHPERGFWGAGRITAVPVRHGDTLRVATRIPLFDAPLTAAELKNHPTLAAMEVLRAPQQSNPSWISAPEWAVLQPLLPL